MKLAAFNVNGVNGRLPALLRWIVATEPDVVGLQELKAADERLPAVAIGAAGYGVDWHGERSWNGVTILARGVEPIETRRGLTGDPGDACSGYTGRHGLQGTIGNVLAGNEFTIYVNISFIRSTLR